jgi:LL-diaminopimelate aminotransferase
MPRFNPLLGQLKTYPAARLEALKQEVIASGKRLFDFAVGDPKEPTPEFIRQACLQSITPNCPYPTVSGRLEVRQAISLYLARRFGVEVDPNRQIIPTAGSKEAVFHTPLLVIDPNADDKTVVFPDPGYPAYQRGALFCGGEAHAHLLDGDHVFRPWQLDPEVVRRTRMIWLNNPHNPSGAITSLDDLKRAADFCREKDILLICDETYADIYQDVVPHSLLEAGVENCLVLHSLSKRSGMTGYRSGFLAGDPDLIARLKSMRANPGLVPQDFINAAAAAAWSDDDHVAARRSVFVDKKKVFLDFFEEVGIEVVASEATIYLWLKVPEGETDETWCARLMSHGIVLSPGRMYGVAGGGAGYVRLALVPPVEECREAIAFWRTVL